MGHCSLRVFQTKDAHVQSLSLPDKMNSVSNFPLFPTVLSYLIILRQREKSHHFHAYSGSLSLGHIKTPSHISCLLQHGKNVKSKQISIFSSGRWGRGALRVFAGKPVCLCCECAAAVCMNDRADLYTCVQCGRGRVCVFESGYMWVCVKACATAQSLRWWGENDEAHSSNKAPCAAHMLGLC